MSFVNQLIIERISIFAKNRPAMEIISDGNSMMRSCSIYESIFKQYITGNMIIHDSAGMLEGYPIVGDEFIYISFKSSNNELTKSYTKVFKIFKVDSLTNVPTKRTQIYTLHFASPILDNSQKSKLQISFKDKREDQIIKSICSLNLGISDEFLEIDQSLYQRTLVVPNWPPLKTISYLTEGAINPGTSSMANFLFYEDSDGFKFKSLEKMMLGEPVTTLTSAIIKNVNKSHPTNVISFDIENCFDNIKNSENGFYGSTAYEVDLIDKKVNKFTYTNEQLLNDQVKIDNTANPIRAEIGEDTDRTTMLTFPNGNYINGFNALPKRLFSMQQFENYKINAEIISNTNFRIGIKVKFDNKSLINTQREHEHRSLSGNFLVTELWHNFTPTDHNMMITLRKPTFKYGVNSKERII